MIYPDELEILKEFVEVLEKLNISYAIGGSIASSFYGKIRFTLDADITLEPFEHSADQFYENLKTRFYISKPAMLQALNSRSSFNIIHIQTSFKIDVFVCQDIPFQRQILEHPKKAKLSDQLEKNFLIVSPEDIILLKLQWYQLTDQTSKKQWDDILGVLSVQGEKLDYNYLKKWATVLKLNELLEKAILQAERQR
jgi:hypothetical protein